MCVMTIYDSAKANCAKVLFEKIVQERRLVVSSFNLQIASETMVIWG